MHDVSIDIATNYRIPRRERETERERDNNWKPIGKASIHSTICDLSYLDGIVEIRREKTLASIPPHLWLNSTLTLDTICKGANRNGTTFNERVKEVSPGICYCDYDIEFWSTAGALFALPPTHHAYSGILLGILIRNMCRILNISLPRMFLINSNFSFVSLDGPFHQIIIREISGT